MRRFLATLHSLSRAEGIEAKDTELYPCIHYKGGTWIGVAFLSGGGEVTHQALDEEKARLAPVEYATEIFNKAKSLKICN